MIEAWLALPATAPAYVARPWTYEGVMSATRPIASGSRSTSADWAEFKHQPANLPFWADLVTAQLEQTLDLPIGWDGHGGIAPTESAVSQLKGLYGLVPASLTVPSVEPSGDGEISLVWRGEHRYFEIGTYGDHAFSYYGKLSEKEFMGEITGSPSSLPKELRLILDAFRYGRL